MDNALANRFSSALSPVPETPSSCSQVLACQQWARGTRLVNRDAIKFLAKCEANGTRLRNCPDYVLLQDPVICDACTCHEGVPSAIRRLGIIREWRCLTARRMTRTLVIRTWYHRGLKRERRPGSSQGRCRGAARVGRRLNCTRPAQPSAHSATQPETLPVDSG